MSFVKKFLIIVFACGLSCTWSSNYAEMEFEDIIKLYRLENAGIKNYHKEKYAIAYEKLSMTARQGLKRSQFYLAHFYLKGQHTPRSIAKGMAWLGVAKESNDPEVVELYERLYSDFNPEQQKLVDQVVEDFIKKYGMATQNIFCQKAKKTLLQTKSQTKKRRAVSCIKTPDSIINGNGIVDQHAFQRSIEFRDLENRINTMARDPNMNPRSRNRTGNY